MSSAEELYPGLDSESSEYLHVRGVPQDIAQERGYQLVRPGKPIDGTYAAMPVFVSPDPVDSPAHSRRCEPAARLGGRA